jgi:hypothetical protein
VVLWRRVGSLAHCPGRGALRALAVRPSCTLIMHNLTCLPSHMSRGPGAITAFLDPGGPLSVPGPDDIPLYAGGFDGGSIAGWRGRRKTWPEGE